MWAAAVSQPVAAQSSYAIDLLWGRAHRELIHAGGGAFDGWTTERTDNSIIMRCTSCQDGAFIRMTAELLPKELHNPRDATKTYAAKRKQYCQAIVVWNEGLCTPTRRAGKPWVPGLIFITDATERGRTLETLLFYNRHVLRAVAKGKRGSPIIENVGPNFPRILLSLTPYW